MTLLMLPCVYSSFSIDVCESWMKLNHLFYRIFSNEESKSKCNEI